MKVKEESEKVGLKLNIQKAKITEEKGFLSYLTPMKSAVRYT